MFLHLLVYDLLHGVHQLIPYIVLMDDLVAKPVKDLALLVHHIVIFKCAFANLKIVLLHSFLCLANGPVEPWMLQFLILLQSQFLHDSDHFFRTVEPHHVVLQGEKKMG